MKLTREQGRFKAAAAISAAADLGLTIDEAEAEGLLSQWEAVQCRYFASERAKRWRHEDEQAMKPSVAQSKSAVVAPAVATVRYAVA